MCLHFFHGQSSISYSPKLVVSRPSLSLSFFPLSHSFPSSSILSPVLYIFSVFLSSSMKYSAMYFLFLAFSLFINIFFGRFPSCVHFYSLPLKVHCELLSPENGSPHVNALFQSIPCLFTLLKSSQE